MKFYNRCSELDLLKRIAGAEGARFVVVKGLRRIGKTRLLLESLKNREYLYVFIPKEETVSGFLEYLSGDLKIPYFRTLSEFFKYIFEKYDYIFLDEFQNFYYMDKAAYSYCQKLFDEYRRENKSLCLFVSGSSYSLMKKIFSDYAKALYGRKDLEINLSELDNKTVWCLLEDLNIKNSQDKLKFWALFGGIPKYYELIEILKPHSFNEFVELIFLHNYRSMLDEGKSILVSEFGGEHKIYYSVIEAVAEGKTTLSEIAGKFNNDSNAANRYITLIKEEYNLINRIRPPLGKKKAQYCLKNNFLSFWFNFIKRYQGYHEQGKTTNILAFFKENFNSYLGKVFEELCLALVKNNPSLFFSFTAIGRQWGKLPDAPKDKNQYEIDICGLNEKTKHILFGECKWEEKVNVFSVLNQLKEKASHVYWHNEDRKEHYALFAKSFCRKVKEKNLHLFDLKRIEKEFRKI